MAEIYKIQTQAQGTMLPSQDRVQLQNDAGMYLKEAAQELNRVGQIIDERSNREATNRMEAAKTMVDDYIKNYNDFSDGYMERMTAGAQQIWDDAYAGLSRNQRVMFERNNPSATAIMQVGIAREVGDKALKHEVDQAKLNNDVLAARMSLDANGRLNNAQTIMDNLEVELNKIQNNPALKAFPDQRAIVAKDLGSKTIGGAIDLALATGRIGTAEKLWGDKSARAFLSPFELAQYKQRIVSYQETLKKQAEEKGSTTTKIEKSKEKFKLMYDSFMRSADAQGIDRTRAAEDFHFITSQIVQGVPVDQLVASPAFVEMQKVIMDNPYADPELKKALNTVGKNGLTFKDIFGEDNIYALQVAAENASSEIAQATNANIMGYIGKSQSLLDNTVNEIIDAHVKDSDQKGRLKSDMTKYLDISDLTPEEAERLGDAVNSANQYITVRDSAQKAQIRRAQQMLVNYEDRVTGTLGVLAEGGHVDLHSATMKGDEIYYLFKRNMYSGNMSVADVQKFTTNKTPVDISGIIRDAYRLGDKNAIKEVQETVDYSWDSTVAAITNAYGYKENPDPGTYGYMIDAAIGKMFYLANDRKYGTQEFSDEAVAIGAEGKTVDGRTVFKMRKDLRDALGLKEADALRLIVNDDPTAPITQTMAYQVVKTAADKAGFRPTGENAQHPEIREDVIQSIADSLRSTMRTRSKAALAELSEKQRKMLLDRRDSRTTIAEAEKIRQQRVERKQRVFGTK